MTRPAAEPGGLQAHSSQGGPALRVPGASAGCPYTLGAVRFRSLLAGKETLPAPRNFQCNPWTLTMRHLNPFLPLLVVLLLLPASLLPPATPADSPQIWPAEMAPGI